MLWKRGKAYPQELRDRVILAADEGIPVGQIAKRFKVSVSYVSKVLSRRAKTGETTARAQVNHVPAKLAEHEAAIRDKLRAERDLTLTELQAWLAKQHAVTVSVRVICKTLKRLNITRKKAPARRRTGSAGCCRGACYMAHSSGHAEPGETGLHRRDRGYHQPCPPLRLGAVRGASDRKSTAWSLEYLDVYRRTAQPRHNRALRLRLCDG